MDWNNVAKNYDQQIYSITKWNTKLDRIINQLKNDSTILIIGCGSEVFLQTKIIDIFPNCRIVCTDYSSEMIQTAQSKYSHPNITYVIEDMLSFSYPNNFDYIVSTNSILMPTIGENSQVFKNCFNSLNEKGTLIGYFPSFESCVNLINKDKTLTSVFILDTQQQSLFDSIDGTSQSFHTNLSLNKETKGYNNVQIMKVSCSETEDEFLHFKDLYGSVLSDNLIREVFEWFIVAQK